VRLDRIYYLKHNVFYETQYKVRTDILCSDHYPIECVFIQSEKSIQDNQINTVNNKKTSLMIIIKDLEIDRMRKKYDIGYDRWMGHLNIFFGFVDRIDFDITFNRIEYIAQTKYLGSELVFDRLESLDQTKYKMLCLMPDEKTKKILCDLRDDINLLLHFTNDPYNPHISLGRFHDDSWKSIKPITYRMTLDRIYMSEYGLFTYVEPKRCIEIKISKTKQQIIDMIQQILNQKILIGGSSVFEDLDKISDSDLDLGIILAKDMGKDADKKSEINNIRKKLIFSGEVFSAEIIDSHHSCYLKIKLFDETDIDLHIGDIDSTYKLDIVEAANHIKSHILKIDQMDKFKESLKLTKQRFKDLGIYGQTYGYLNGIGITIMLCHLFINHLEKIKMIEAKDIMILFCQTYSKWFEETDTLPRPIFINVCGKTDGSKASSMMRIHNVVPPYENTQRNLTRSTYDIIMDALNNNLEKITLIFSNILTIGIRSNDLNTFYQMMRYIESEILNIIIGYEAVGCMCRPNKFKCHKKSETSDPYMFYGYLTFDLTKATQINKLEKLKQSIMTLYPNQMFRYKVT
jgi:hypothetical protein